MTASNLPVALVTGASSGIGLASAHALQRAGYRVFGTTRKAAGTVSGITMLSCDLTNDASVAATVAAITTEVGRVDVLVNNAGAGLFGGAEESSIDQAKELFEINVFAVLRMTNAVLPIMRHQNTGRIVNLSSVLGLIPAPYGALYAASKHAIEGYSESMDHETRAFGVRITLVEPGYTRTAFDQNSTLPDRPLAAYETARRAVQARGAQSIKSGDDPKTVGKVVLEAATAENPKARYTAGKLAGQARLLRRFVPEAAFSKKLRKQNGLPA